MRKNISILLSNLGRFQEETKVFLFRLGLMTSSTITSGTGHVDDGVTTAHKDVHDY